MGNKLFKQFKKYTGKIQNKGNVAGILGLPNSAQTVSVPGRNGYVYVRIRNTNEIVQAFNDKVTEVHNLPVLLRWEGGRYKVVERDVKRYQNWGAYSNFVPTHTHDFEPWVVVQEEGITVGTGSILNFVGETVSVNMVGQTARIYISGSIAPPEGANKSLSNLQSTSINEDLIPASNMTGTLGEEFRHWREAWVGDIFLMTQTGTSAPPYNTHKIWADTSGSIHSKVFGGADNILAPDAPTDGTTYARKDRTWVPVAGNIVAQNEGATVGTGTVFNFVGNNVDVTASGTVIQINVSGTTTPFASYWGSSSTYISGSKSAYLVLDVADIDEAGLLFPSGTTFLYVTSSGWYEIWANVQVTPVSSTSLLNGNIMMSLIRNLSIVHSTVFPSSESSSISDLDQFAQTLINLSAGQRVGVYIENNTTGTIDAYVSQFVAKKMK